MSNNKSITLSKLLKDVNISEKQEKIQKSNDKYSVSIFQVIKEEK